MVGSISNPVDTATIVSVPAGLKGSAWFGFGPSGYEPSSQIVPGKAYWVRSNGAGKFVFANPLANPARTQSSGAGVLEGLNTLTVSSTRGSQKLYFGMDANKDVPADMYAMPPAPPVGAFDARFETADGGSMVQTRNGQSASEFTVKVQSDAYPLVLSWDVNDRVYEATAGSWKQVLRGTGTSRIANNEVEKIVLRLVSAGELPRQFELSQNYPNPFNPSTVIRYDIPTNAIVKISIYDMLGREVATLVNGNQMAGHYNVTFNAKNLPSGVYLYSLHAGDRTFVQKMLLLK
jgi:hypothetical protein